MPLVPKVALIWEEDGPRPDHSLPIPPGHPGHPIVPPGYHPDNTLPAIPPSIPIAPDNSLPGGGGGEAGQLPILPNGAYVIVWWPHFGYVAVKVSDGRPVRDPPMPHPEPR